MEPRHEEMKEQKASQVRKKILKLAIGIMTMLSAAVLLTVSASRADVENSNSSNGSTVTKIRANGLVVATNLSDSGYAGFLVASRDQIAGTSQLDFSFATRDPDNPNIVLLWQGAGEIPNSAFTISPNGSSARVAVTTSFPVILAEIDVETGAIIITPWTPPMTFDLTWVQNGFMTTFGHVQQTDTFGPLTIRFAGTYSSVSALVNGTWDGHTATDSNGVLQDTHNNTVLREITIDPNP